MYSKTHRQIQNDEATIQEYTKAVSMGATEYATRIYQANPDLTEAFDRVDGTRIAKKGEK